VASTEDLTLPFVSPTRVQDAGNNSAEFLDGAVETTATCSLSPTGDEEHDALASTFFNGLTGNQHWERRARM